MDTHFACRSCPDDENCKIQDLGFVEDCEIVEDYEHEMKQIQFNEYMKEKYYFLTVNKLLNTRC